MLLATALWTFLRALSTGAAGVALENLALRHQLLVLQRSVTRPRLSRWDRVLWVWLSRLWTDWRLNLIIVQPATVLAWHRQGFQLYWRWRSTANRVGRPKLDAEIRHLIHRMARDNPTWGRRRIRAELALLGYAVAELTVAKYMDRTSSRPSPTWRVFLATHARDIVAIDFFVVPTLTFRLLSSSSAFAMTAASSSISTLRIIPPQSGPPARSLRPSRTRPLRDICSEIVMPSTARASPGPSPTWGFER
jgi:putative transposase